MSTFADNLRGLRTKMDLKQADIAKYLNVSMQSYSAYENGREPNYDILCKLAKYFGTSTDYLIGFSEYKSAKEQLLYESLNATRDLPEDNNIYVVAEISTEVHHMLDGVSRASDYDSSEMRKSIRAAFSILRMYCDNLDNANRNRGYLESDQDKMRPLLKALSAIRNSALTYDELRFIDIEQPQISAFVNHLRKFIYLYTMQCFDFEKANM